ncbi:metallophosphoesterase [bacterium]|nr:metallophosphoesterase [bacterium]
MVKIVCMSDTHGRHHGLIVPDGNILVHCGDFSARGTELELMGFLGWFALLPHPHKVFIAGNHDEALSRGYEYEWLYGPQKVHYLCDSGVEILGLKFWGTPWVPPSAGRFILPVDARREKFALIPGDVDVLITHGPPRGFLDQSRNGMHWGCEVLQESLTGGTLRPKLWMFGHIHGGYGELDVASRTKLVNCAVMPDYGDGEASGNLNGVRVVELD